MGYAIAIAGKGGTGKTTIAALIIRILKEKKAGSILGIDADPNSNLAEILGIIPKQTIGRILDEISSHPHTVPVGMPKDRFIEYQVQTAIEEGEGFDVLTMGRPEGPGCYCYVNNTLRNVTDKLIKDYDYVVIDNEAGLEHLSRRTTRSADVMVIVSDPTVIGLRAAKRIQDLSRELDIKIKKSLLIVNRLNNHIDLNQVGKVGVPYLADIPVDNEISILSINGSSIWELNGTAPSIASLRKSGEAIWERN
jgi:CO dehydrogenase maturation factor